MALISCPECQAKISSDAEACPHCGRRRREPSGGRSVFLVIASIAFGVYIVTKEPSTPAPPQPPETPEQIAAKEAKERRFQAVAAYALALKQAMKNPDSFRLVQAIRMDSGSICFVYRGTNSFGAVVTEHVVVTSKGSQRSQGAWKKECEGKSGEDFSSLRAHPALQSSN